MILYAVLEIDSLSSKLNSLEEFGIEETRSNDVILDYRPINKIGINHINIYWYVQKR